MSSVDATGAILWERRRFLKAALTVVGVAGWPMRSEGSSGNSFINVFGQTVTGDTSWHYDEQYIPFVESLPWDLRQAIIGLYRVVRWSPIWTGTAFSRFERLNPEQRKALLEEIQGSSSYEIRSLFRSAKGICLMHYYNESRHQLAIGYQARCAV